MTKALIELDEDQLSLLKACTSAQQELLLQQARDYPADREACFDQRRECAGLHDILTAAQSEIRESKQTG